MRDWLNRVLAEHLRPEARRHFVEAGRAAVPLPGQPPALGDRHGHGGHGERFAATPPEVRAQDHEWINHSLVPTQLSSHDFRVTIGAGRPQPYSASVFNISAMSFGALSAHAILALNGGAARGGFAHDTGEGSISDHHRVHGGDLIWEIGSGYFGCRQADGSFDPEAFAAAARSPQVKMIELKLSQGARPGQGGVLPAAKVTPEIAQARGVPSGVDCVSPARHSAFDTPLQMLQFIERLRDLSGGKPTGFKLCIGHPWEWFAICKAMLATGIEPDFIVVDGAEGGTGEAPLRFTEQVGAPLQEGLLLVHNTLLGLNLRSKIRIGCAGKVAGAFDIARAMALGADWCNAARGFMTALGCQQAQACHTGACPSGVATQDPRRQKALVVPDKIERVHHHHQDTLLALKELVQAAGLRHPNEINAFHIVRRAADHEVRPLASVLPFVQPGSLLAAARGRIEWPHRVYRMYWPLASADSFAPGQPVELPQQPCKESAWGLLALAQLDLRDGGPGAPSSP